MLTEQQLQGIYVPLVTPFNSNGELDLESFSRHTASLLEAGVHGLIVNGTTGESPTVTTREIALLMEAARNAAKSTSVPLVLGTGTNDTATTVKRTEDAGMLGADAALVVVPYYSRPSQQGIIEHYRRVAKTGVPVIVYDIPYRTGVTLEWDTIRTLMEMDGIIGVKDSTGGSGLVSQLSRSESKPVMCGDDEQFFISLCCGARGGMLASANVFTKHFIGVYNTFMNGSVQEAKSSFDQLVPLIRLLFAEPNPAPLKWLLARQGLIANGALRLPMMPISSGLERQLESYRT